MSDLSTSVSLISAFVGGLLSFLSPCVLPIVPGESNVFRNVS